MHADTTIHLEGLFLLVQDHNLCTFRHQIHKWVDAGMHMQQAKYASKVTTTSW